MPAGTSRRAGARNGNLAPFLQPAEAMRRIDDNRAAELAGELLDVVNPAELDAFLARLVREVGARRALTAQLAQTAARTVPTLAVALGPRRVPPAAVEIAA